MNANGFAISTILYGILIMAMLIMTLLVGTMAFTRKSSVDLISQIEDQLNQCVSYTNSGCR